MLEESFDWRRTAGVRNMFFEQFRVSVKWRWQACATLTYRLALSNGKHKKEAGLLNK